MVGEKEENGLFLTPAKGDGGGRGWVPQAEKNPAVGRRGRGEAIKRKKRSMRGLLSHKKKRAGGKRRLAKKKKPG